jgi:hypothetical protein
MTGQPGTVMACSLDRPHPTAGGALVRERKRLPAPARRGRHRPLRHDRARRRDDNSEHMLVPVRIDTNHVIHLICKHHY